MTETEAGVDAVALESYLAAELGVDSVRTEVLHEGLNLTIGISTPNAERAYVLRRPNESQGADYSNEPDSEYEVLRRLRDAPISTPEPVLYCDDGSIVGDSFFVATHLDGEAVPLGSALPERFRNPESRRRVAEQLVAALADVHSVDAGSFPGVCERLPPREQVARDVERLDAVVGATGRELPRLRAVGEWLRRNVPSNPETTLVHGDFRPGNVLFAGDDRPELTGVLDWETTFLGDPLTELGYLLLRWRDEGDPTPSLDALEARYSNEEAIEHLRGVNEKGLAPFTAEPGSPTRRELVARYEDLTGRSFENERFYRAHAAFGLATVWADLHRRRIETGAESDWEPHVEYVAMVAESIVDGEFRL